MRWRGLWNYYSLTTNQYNTQPTVLYALQVLVLRLHPVLRGLPAGRAALVPCLQAENRDLQAAQPVKIDNGRRRK
jgi:hypothetical protein